MLQALVRNAGRLLEELRRSLFPPRPSAAPTAAAPELPKIAYGPLQRVVLTDGVGRTLFEEYAGHRRRDHGETETGWILMGLREQNSAVVLATLPAGALADAGVAHVRFNSEAQALASRIVRQDDRRLTILGVVHTHPGSLRHPSDGDYTGDREWVVRLRGREGVFAIGTADAPANVTEPFALQPRPNVQSWEGLQFSWYALGEKDTTYRPLPVELTYGPDVARTLHELWPALEQHARALDNLYGQLTGCRFEAIRDDWGPGLVLRFPLRDKGDYMQVLVRNKEVRYHLQRGDTLLEVDAGTEPIDRAVFLMLAELAARP
jgi:proteasome lid subunit RPN8/RPN11